MAPHTRQLAELWPTGWRRCPVQEQWSGSELHWWGRASGVFTQLHPVGGSSGTSFSSSSSERSWFPVGRWGPSGWSTRRPPGQRGMPPSLWCDGSRDNTCNFNWALSSPAAVHYLLTCVEKQNPSRGARRLLPSRRFKLRSLGVASNETCLLKVRSFPANAPNVIATLSGEQTHSEGQCT